MRVTQLTAAGPQVASSFSRPICAIGLAATGIGIAWFFLGIGYVVLVGLLDATCCPPLEAQANFGQFGFFIIIIAPMLLLCGTSFVLIPFLRWWLWALCFVLIFAVPYFLTGIIEAWHCNWLHVTNVALYLTGMILCVLGTISRFIYRYFELRELDDHILEEIVGK